MSEITQKTEHSAFVDQKDNNKLGFWVFLGGEIILFGSLIGAYLIMRFKHPDEFLAAKAHLSVPLIAINTFILIVSSYMVVRALEAIRGGNLRGLRWNMLAVEILGFLFLLGQANEWRMLFADGVSFTSVFGTPFLTTTGIHGSHVFVGLIWSIFIQLGIARGHYTQRQFRRVEVFGLYWHFVDIVWIVLFTLFYLI